MSGWCLPWDKQGSLAKQVKDTFGMVVISCEAVKQQTDKNVYSK